MSAGTRTSFGTTTMAHGSSGRRRRPPLPPAERPASARGVPTLPLRTPGEVRSAVSLRGLRRIASFHQEQATVVRLPMDVKLKLISVPRISRIGRRGRLAPRCASSLRAPAANMQPSMERQSACDSPCAPAHGAGCAAAPRPLQKFHADGQRIGRFMLWRAPRRLPRPPRAMAIPRAFSAAVLGRSDLAPARWSEGSG